MKNEKKSTYSLPVRIVCIIMAALVSSGILMYLAMFLMDLLG
jgi:hypothetical protein